MEKLVRHQLRWFRHVQRRPPETPVRSGILRRNTNEKRGRRFFFSKKRRRTMKGFGDLGLHQNVVFSFGWWPKIDVGQLIAWQKGD
jgi:hypothetical protein